MAQCLQKVKVSNQCAEKSKSKVTFCPATTHILNVSKHYTKTMRKNILLFIYTAFSTIASFGQIAMSSPDIDIENACNENLVYAFLTDKASNMTFNEIERLLNEEIDFVKSNPKFKTKCAVQNIVNCKGEASTFHMVTESKSKEFDKQLLEFFNKLSDWKTANYKNQPVDYWFMWLIKVKKGVIYLENGK